MLLDKQMDSKVSRSFLRMVLKEQGQPVPDDLEINSWEMVDLIIKNIHLVDIEVKNLKAQIKQLQAQDAGRRERIFDAIEAFYGKQQELRS